MATFTIYTYIEHNINLFTLGDFRDFVTGSIGVFFHNINYLYDDENDMLHPVKSSDDRGSWTLNELYNAKRRTSIIVKTRRVINRHQLLTTVDLIDWEKTIQQLEQAGKVVTMETKSFFSESGKKFYFVSDVSSASEPEALDVDYLGTKLADLDGISQRVLDEWNLIR